MVEFDDDRPDGYRPFQLIGVILVSLLAFGAIFLSFLLAPLAILLIFYVFFAAADRNKRSTEHHQEPPADEPPAELPPGPGTGPTAESIMRTPVRGAVAPPRA